MARHFVSAGVLGSGEAFVTAEPLEARCLMSAPSHIVVAAKSTANHAAAAATATAKPAVSRARRHAINTDWQTAPFDRHQYRATVYVNQYGDATLTNEPLTLLNGYDVFYDDGGPITATVTGSTPTDVAYYSDVGYPSNATDTGGTRGTTSVTGTVTPDKDMEYVAVRPHAGASATGTFNLQISGPAEGVPYPLSVSSKNDAGSSGSDISGTNDYDFYRFTLPRNGNYLFQATPNGKLLDLSMNVYDNAGNPIGGTYTSPINNTGPGQTENFTGVGLLGGHVYWLRVDGVNDQAGGYGVSVQIAPDLPDVGVTTTDSTATPGRRRSPGVFTVTRSNATGAPLTLTYRVRGTAVAGKDYAALTGTVTIPANATSATINVNALGGGAGGNVVLYLNGGAAYNITDNSAASVNVIG